MNSEATATQALDRMLIREAVEAYGSHYDDQRMDEFAALFTKDAVLDFEPDPGYFPTPLVGREMIVRHMSERGAVVSATAQRRHLTTNTIFRDLTANSARTESFLAVLTVDHGGGVPLVNAMGVYHDLLHKVDGRWLIAERRTVIDAVRSATSPSPKTDG